MACASTGAGGGATAAAANILIMRLVLCYTYFTLLPFHISSQQHATRNPRGTCPATESPATRSPLPPQSHRPLFASLHCLHVKWVRGLRLAQSQLGRLRGGATLSKRCVKFDFILDKKKCSYFGFTFLISTAIMDFYERVISGNLLRTFKAQGVRFCS